MRPFLTHLATWVGFAIYEQSIILITSTTKFIFLFALVNYLLNAALFYTSCNLLFPALYNRKRYFLFSLAALSLLATFAFFRSAVSLYLAPLLHIPELPYSVHQLWVSSVYRGTFFLLISTGYWFARNAIVLEKQKRDAERSLMQANVAFLKSQINPHFLFNSLNFLYAQVYPHSENAAKSILLLADTMRYALHEDSSGKVMLTQEVEHLHNYIAINQLRFNKKLNIDFEIVGNIQFLMILPLVLITFVENCFKHGQLDDPANPLVIRLETVQNQLAFYSHNKKRHGPKEKSTGIGLVNTRKRLEILYPDRHELVLKDEPDYYTCTLTITL
jgi:sensor histidine kinase YesM